MEAPEAIGDCYDANAWALLWERKDELEGWLLCHGEPVLEVPPFCRHGHAWLECPEGHHVRDFSMGRDVEMRRELYYFKGKIEADDVVRYTAAEARRHIKKYGHWGPWDSENPPLEGAEDD